VVATELEGLPPPPHAVVERRAQALHRGHSGKQDRARRTVKASGSDIRGAASWRGAAAGTEESEEEEEEGLEEYGNGSSRRGVES
jgi:hypothetical protein